MGNVDKYLEDYGDLFKNIGSGETSGRIFGLLMAGEQPKMTLDELSDRLGRSRSTVHAALKKLLADGIISYDVDDEEPSEGRYQHLYQLNPNFWEGRLKQLEAITLLKNLLGNTVEHLEEMDQNDPRLEPLKELHHMYSWFEKRMPELFEEYEVIRKEEFGK